MAPSQKQKRKPLPKRPCPCCRSLLSEKTIEHHASRTHIPTCINVTLAAAGWEQPKFFSDISGDLSGDSSENNPKIESSIAPHPTNADDDHALVKDSDSVADAGGLEKIIQTWSGCRSQVDYYKSDTEDKGEALEEDARDSDVDSEFEREGTRIHNGLGMDDLIDEDLQCIIAEFSMHLFSLCYYYYNH